MIRSCSSNAGSAWGVNGLVSGGALQTVVESEEEVADAYPTLELAANDLG